MVKTSTGQHQKIVVIGAGFSGLSAACYLADAGFQVHVVAKHEQVGGRARMWEQDGFRFDMGPGWYWMPEIFEGFFQHFGKKVSDYYELQRLDPSYRVYFADDVIDVPTSIHDREALFERLEPGVTGSFRSFLEQTKYIYEIATQDYLLRPCLSVTEFMDWRVARELFRLKMTQSVHGYISRFFKHPHLRQIAEWPVLFLGAQANKTMAMYSLMSYAEIAFGTWYPKGGMHRIIEGMASLAKSLGVIFHTGEEVQQIQVSGGRVRGVQTSQTFHQADCVVASADYHHVEQALLEPQYRQYSERYWDACVMSPSSLVFYLGIQGKIPELLHHNLFFDRDVTKHFQDVYDTPRWPEEPIFYARMTSKTDPGTAPADHENLFLQVPLAPGLQDTPAERERCYDKLITRLEQRTGHDLRARVVYKRSYAMQDFVTDYHAYKGNAYGMANTLRQTGPFKPKLRSEKVTGLYFAGHLTVPGPGVPPSLISGQLASKVLQDDLA